MTKREEIRRAMEAVNQRVFYDEEVNAALGELKDIFRLLFLIDTLFDDVLRVSPGPAEISITAMGLHAAKFIEARNLVKVIVSEYGK